MFYAQYKNDDYVLAETDVIVRHCFYSSSSSSNNNNNNNKVY